MVSSMQPCPSCGYENVMGSDRCEGCLHSLMQVDLPQPAGRDSLAVSMMTFPVGELVRGKDFLVCRKEDPVSKVLEILRKESKDCILVYEEHKLVGIVSLRDLLGKVAGKVADLSSITAGSIMTSNPEYLKADAPLAYAVNQMALGRFRHLPVVDDDGAPINILSILDLLAYLTNRAVREVRRY